MRMCLCVYACMHAYVCECTRVCVFVCLCVYVCVCICLCLRVCVCDFMYVKCNSVLSSPEDRILRYMRTYLSYVSLGVIAK